mgnify:CR=1 FL=1
MDETGVKDLYGRIGKGIIEDCNKTLKEIEKDPTKYDRIYGCGGTQWIRGLTEDVKKNWEEKEHLLA